MYSETNTTKGKSPSSVIKCPFRIMVHRLQHKHKEIYDPIILIPHWRFNAAERKCATSTATGLFTKPTYIIYIELHSHLSTYICNAFISKLYVYKTSAPDAIKNIFTRSF